MIHRRGAETQRGNHNFPVEGFTESELEVAWARNFPLIPNPLRSAPLRLCGSFPLTTTTNNQSLCQKQ